MIFLKDSHFIKEKRIFTVLTVASLLFFSKEVRAQEQPPRPVEVNPTTQELRFGAFTYAVATGTVTVTPAGGRSAVGVVLLNLSIPTAALFNVAGNVGTLVTITFGPSATLNCTCGGTMTLNIDTSNPVSPFPIALDYPVPNLLYIGGTLTVGNSSTSPPGDYTGTFDITLGQN